MPSRATVPLLLAVLAAAPSISAQTLVLEIRVFDGFDEVTAETRITVHRAGERTSPVAQLGQRAGRRDMEVAAGIYDVQAVRERDGRVVSIRWAERLVVMPYPDEAGRHLEVINFKNGFGALQLRRKASDTPGEALAYAEGTREKAAGSPIAGQAYVLFVVPAGRYDVQTRTNDRPVWHTGIEVPLDRTRLWIVP